MAVATQHTSSSTSLPPIVSREEWQAARQELLLQEKALTKHSDAVAAARRRLPMVEIDNDYTFVGADGEVTLLDLFEGRNQLIVQHFMFAPEWEAGCPGCSRQADSFPHPGPLHTRGISVARISRAPYPKLAAYNARMGWNVRWVSSFGSTFNRDFGYTDDNGEVPATAVYLRDGDRIFQTYATTGRGFETQLSEVGYLDMTPFGRQEAWEDSPEGWPQVATHSWLKLHDEYGS